MHSNGHTTHGPLDVVLNYYLEPEDGGTTRILPGTLQDKLPVQDPHTVHVEDARGRESEFRLDVHGFQLLNYSAELDNFLDPSGVTAEYYDEIRTLLKQRYVPDWQVFDQSWYRLQR